MHQTHTMNDDWHRPGARPDRIAVAVSPHRSAGGGINQGGLFTRARAGITRPDIQFHFATVRRTRRCQAASFRIHDERCQLRPTSRDTCASSPRTPLAAGNAAQLPRHRGGPALRVEGVKLRGASRPPWRCGCMSSPSIGPDRGDERCGPARFAREFGADLSSVRNLRDGFGTASRRRRPLARPRHSRPARRRLLIMPTCFGNTNAPS